MPPVYFDGIQLQRDYARWLIIAMGTLDHVCAECGGSNIEIKSIAIHSSESTVVFSVWCRACGSFSRLDQEFPLEWHTRFLAEVDRNLALAIS